MCESIAFLRESEIRRVLVRAVREGVCVFLCLFEGQYERECVRECEKERLC